MTRLLHRIFAFVALATAAGCAAIPQGSEPASLSPASPQASEGGYPTAQAALMAGTNYAMPPQAESQPMGTNIDMKMNMDMSGHGKQPMKTPGHGGQQDVPVASASQHEHHEGAAPKP